MSLLKSQMLIHGNYCAAHNLGIFITVRKLLEKILAADHTNNSSLAIRTYNIWWIKLLQFANCLPNLKLCPAKILCCMV